MSGKLKLKVLSQERELLTTEVDSVTVPSAEGELTILFDHIPLLTELVSGEVVFRNGQTSESIVVSKGFMDVGHDDVVTIMVDVAKHERDLSVEKAQQAVNQAQETLLTRTANQQELMRAEASLRQALLELRVAQRTKKTKI